MQITQKYSGEPKSNIGRDTCSLPPNPNYIQSTIEGKYVDSHIIAHKSRLHSANTNNSNQMECNIFCFQFHSNLCIKLSFERSHWHIGYLHNINQKRWDLPLRDCSEHNLACVITNQRGYIFLTFETAASRRSEVKWSLRRTSGRIGSYDDNWGACSRTVKANTSGKLFEKFA